MRSFAFARPTTISSALAALAPDPRARFIAGGTNLVDLMVDLVEAPPLVVDINGLPLRGIERNASALRIGALARMSDVADHPEVRAAAPFVAEALDASASAQLRNAASIGGNVLQRTRCSYFRDVTQACNKRSPGSGCAAIGGENRMNAVLGGSDACIATHASDLAVALVAANARIVVRGPAAERTIALRDFYVKPAADPRIENTLAHGELIIAIEIPADPVLRTSTYVKVRDRHSYEFALASVALALETSKGVVTDARLAFGGVGTIPWHSPEAERMLLGGPATPQAFSRAADVALAGAIGRGHNDYKPQLARRTLAAAFAKVTA